ncbi:P-loop containing nucleoside triphosphate hydrolase protein [Zopfia rhizophila CBS 207.26]|uniref:DNA 3'-5' helicase n=1 Tax=Zopfia rhizophila CBS 207.26 TaxID=1314779 RepID=A0A6A6D4W6_9PEZI|nr:P-loop containing nucleoside triphosphate hydrolase protein [Zopfia rhizophila CBS 207.26]KAF2174605.1 P-loop containing nucleoside triphosphate hydrolase protein [Zopfia rhizophila CBS 207.26]
MSPTERAVKSLRTAIARLKEGKISQQLKQRQKQHGSDLITKIIKKLFGKTPRPIQIECIYRLAMEEKDTILVAKTGFGKSMIFQAVSLLFPDKITLAILPLNEIANDQERVITQAGGSVLVLNADTPNRTQEVERARAGHYSYIILSPELAVDEKFRGLFTDHVFRDKLGLVAIDEAHLVRTWGEDFREAYQQLGRVRSLLNDSAPWFACSATLDKDTMDELINSVGFSRGNNLIVRTPITRKEIAFRCGHMIKGTFNSFASLRFLFDDVVQPSISYNQLDPYVKTDQQTLDSRFITPERIPKTIVFVNSRKDAANSLERITATFHRRVSHKKKKAILDEFRKPDSNIRVVFATEAIGMGVDIPDVRRVVLYGFPAPKKDLGIILQRGGRAARDGKPGECIFLFEEWAKGPREVRPPTNRPLARVAREQDPGPTPPPGSDSEGEFESDIQTGSITKTNAQRRRTELPMRFWELANNKGCMRRIIYDYFQENENDRASNTDKDRCCTFCNKSLQLPELKRDIYHENGPKLTQEKQDILQKLLNWAKDMAFDIVVPLDADIPRQPEVVIPYDIAKDVALYSDKVTLYPDLLQYISGWEYKDMLSTELFRALKVATKGLPSQSQPQDSQFSVPGGSLSTFSATSLASSSQERQPLSPVSANRQPRTSTSTWSSATNAQWPSFKGPLSSRFNSL